VYRLRLTTRPLDATMHTAAALLLAAGGVACTPDRAPDAAPRAAAPAVPAPAVPAPAVAATVAETPPSPAGAASGVGPPPAEIRAVCDSVVARWRAIPDASVASIDTVTEARDVDGGNDAQRYPACVVRARREAGLDSTMYRRRFWPADASWTPVWRLDADGPDGNVRTYQRALVRCEVWEQQDGGDDGDSTYVPSPFFGEVTTCWRHRFPVRVTDTLHAAP
jgi:hypothetical protein